MKKWQSYFVLRIWHLLVLAHKYFFVNLKNILLSIIFHPFSSQCVIHVHQSQSHQGMLLCLYISAHSSDFSDQPISAAVARWKFVRCLTNERKGIVRAVVRLWTRRGYRREEGLIFFLILIGLQPSCPLAHSSAKCGHKSKLEVKLLRTTTLEIITIPLQIIATTPRNNCEPPTTPRKLLWTYKIMTTTSEIYSNYQTSTSSSLSSFFAEYLFNNKYAKFELYH